MPLTYKKEPIKILVTDLFLLVSFLSYLIVFMRITYTIYLCKPFLYKKPSSEHFKVMFFILLFTTVLSIIIDISNYKIYKEQLDKEFLLLKKSNPSINYYQHECSKMKSKTKI